MKSDCQVETHVVVYYNACMENVLNLAGWTILDTKETDQGYQFVAVYAIEPLCVYCHSSDIQRFGKKEQLFLDLPMHGRRVGVQVQRRRYRCKRCQRTMIQPLPDMDDKRLMTTRLIRYIQEQSLRRTFVSIAAEVSLDEKTIRNIFHDYVAELEKTHVFQTPRWLGIDELLLVRKQRCILTNVRAGTIIGLLPARTSATVTRFLSEMPDRQQIELVCMDMWVPYRDVARACLPQAQIIVDKFHVERMANLALEEVRKTVRASLTDRQRRTLMHDRYVLLRRRHDLDERGQLILAAWTQTFPVLAQAYDADD
jgi:transposase